MVCSISVTLTVEVIRDFSTKKQSRAKLWKWSMKMLGLRLSREMEGLTLNKCNRPACLITLKQLPTDWGREELLCKGLEIRIDGRTISLQPFGDWRAKTEGKWELGHLQEAPI